VSLLDLKPNVRPFSAQDYWTIAEGVTPPAFDALSAGAAEGAMTSYGLGTVVRDLMTPDPVPQDDGRIMDRDLNAPRKRAALEARQEQARREGGGELDEAGWKASEFARDGLKWEPGMTRARAAALADLYDESQYRQYILSNAKGGAYAAGIAGQFLGAATDPINYVPVLGPATKLAAVAKFGRIGGGALVAGADAALNTAAAGLLTRDARATYGDDVSWTSFAIDVAMGAAIGGAFGGGVGAWERLRANRVANTLPRVGQAQAALSEAAGDIVNGRSIRLSDATIAAMRRDAGELAPELRRASNAATEFPAERLERPTSLTEFIARAGGMRDEGGELAAMGLTGEGVGRGANLRRGYGSVINQRGMSIDQAREAAEEAGYLVRADENATTSVNDFLDAISREARGERVYSVRDAEQAQLYEQRLLETRQTEAALQREADADDAIIEASDEMGVVLTPDEREAVRTAVLDHGMAADDAIESVVRAGTKGLFLAREIDPSEVPPFFDDEFAAAEAAASIGKPLSGEKAFAEDLGIDIETGDSAAMLELDQLRQAGRLTEADEAMLAEIDGEASRAQAIGDALIAAALCRMT
jgi:hypothetical protein